MTSPDSTKTKAPLAERLIFSKRPLVMLLMLIATIVLAWQATQLKVAASFEKMIPTNHEYVVNFLENRADLTSLGNVVRVTVQTKEGDIFDAEYLETLKQVTDKAFYIPGVNRPEMASLWTANTRWTSVTEEGLEGGQVIPATYNGDAESIAQVRQNVELSGQIGRLVGNDFKSTIVYLPLLEINPETGNRLDYKEFSERIEAELRNEFNSDKIEIRVTGFAKIVGDLIEGATQVVMFFGIAVLITLVMLFFYSRSVKSTLATLACSITAVIWQLGLLNAMGMGLDPYSMLVPFLVFAIGVSHGVQIVGAIAHKQGEGHNRLDSARLAFRGLYIAGLTALVSDGFGFATLMVIDIPVIRDLAIAASVGVAVIILTNLVLLPLIMSYTGVDEKAVAKLQQDESGSNKLWHFLAGFAQAKWQKVHWQLPWPCWPWACGAMPMYKLVTLTKAPPSCAPIRATTWTTPTSPTTTPQVLMCLWSWLKPRWTVVSSTTRWRLWICSSGRLSRYPGYKAVFHWPIVPSLSSAPIARAT